jgi:hypothetical protein
VITKDSSLIDVAFAVCTLLDERGIRAVLTGGSAATYWAPQVYQSRDADFVLSFCVDAKEVVKAMRELGYRSDGGTWIHDECMFTVDFPPGPLAIGDERIDRYDTMQRDDQSLLHVLSPQDSVRDRLAHFIHWKDRSALRAAVGIAKCRDERVDRGALRRWAKSEHPEGDKRFVEFERALKGRGADGRS